MSNLSVKLDRFGLKGVFHKAGKVIDTYIPVGRTGFTRRRYGFVRFGSRLEADRSIQILSNKIVRGYRIQVSMARSNQQKRRFFSTKGTGREKPVNQ